MKIEKNKFYRTKDGRKARIYETEGGGFYKIHGAIYGIKHIPNGWFPYMWDSAGFCSHHGNDEEPHLVSEWEDPPKKLKAYLCDSYLIEDNGEDVKGTKGVFFSEKDLTSYKRAKWLDPKDEM